MQSLFPSTRALICFTSKSPHGQAVKTSPSHGGIWGSIPHGGTKKALVSSAFSFFIYPPWLIAHSVCATSLPEPQNTGLTLHYVSKLTRFAISRFPMGVPKKTSPLGLVCFIRCLQRHVINACVVCNCSRSVSPHVSLRTTCAQKVESKYILTSGRLSYKIFLEV